MNRTSKTAITVLSLLCIALAISTVVQATSRARPVDQPAPVEPAMPPEMAEGGAPSLEEASFEEIDAPPDAAPLGFVGEWLNEDEDLGTLTRITINNVDDQFAIQPWAAHASEERPYGPPVELDLGANPTEITWDAGFAQQKIRLAVMPEGLLRVDRVAECMNHRCGTPQPATTEYFFKANQEDLAAHAEAVAEAVPIADVECVPEIPGGG